MHGLGDAGRRTVSRGRRRTRSLGAPLFLEWSLGLVLVGSVLGLGAVHPETLVVVALAGLPAVVLALRAMPRIPLPTWVFVGLGVWSLIQAVPLPAAVVREISPGSADIWARAFLPFDEPASTWASLSIDRGASLVEALRWCLYGGVFAVAACVAARSEAKRVTQLVVITGIALTVVNVSHALLGWRAVYGFYEPHGVPLHHVSPLVNSNNQAGYFNLCSFCGLAQLLSRRPFVPRWMSAAGVAITVCGTVLAGSRAGLLTLIAGVAAVAVMLVLVTLKQKTTAELKRTYVLAGVAVLVGVGLATLGTTAQLRGELAERGTQRWLLISWSVPMILDHFWTGVGRGAFETAFGAYRAGPIGSNMVVTHVENFVLDWAAEWGAPVAVTALGLLGWTVWGLLPWVRERIAASTLMIGLGILLLHNMADVAMEVPAVVLAAVTVFGAVWGEAHASVLAPLRRSPSSEGRAVRVRWLGLAAAMVGLLAAVWLFARDSAFRDRRATHARLQSSNLQRAQDARRFRSELRAAIARHPGDAYLPLAGGIAAFRAGDQSPIPWLQRTLERDVFSGGAHYVLAHFLWGHGHRHQAFLELRLAAESDVAFVGPVAKAVASWAESQEDVERAVPQGRSGADLLSAIADVLPRTIRGERLRRGSLREALARAPGLTSPRLRLASDLLADVEGHSVGLCRDEWRERCIEEVKQHVNSLRSSLPSSSVAAELEARVLMVLGKHQQAEQLLAEQCPQHELRLDCLRAHVRAALEVGHPERLERAVVAFRGASCTDAQTCATELEWLGDLVAHRANWPAAMGYYARAAREVPSPQRWEKVARAAEQIGADDLASDARARSRQP